MRAYPLSVLLVLPAILIPVINAKATLVPNLDMEALCNTADIIVVAAVTEVRREGETIIEVQGQAIEALSMTAKLTVNKVLKGVLSDPRLSLRFWIPPPIGFVGIGRGQFGIFFVRKVLDGFEVLDPYHPFVAAAPGAPEAVGTTNDKVTAELAYAAAAAQDSQMRIAAVEALSAVPTPVARVALKTIARDGNAGTRLLAVAALLQYGDIEWLGPAADALLSHDQPIDDSQVAYLTFAIEQGVRDPKAIPILDRLMQAREIRTRRAAAEALRNTRNQGAIEPLIKALQDEDRDVQYQAVIGLAEITGVTGEWAPATDTFLKDPQRYLNHWRDWANEKIK